MVSWNWPTGSCLSQVSLYLHFCELFQLLLCTYLWVTFCVHPVTSGVIQTSSKFACTLLHCLNCSWSSLYMHTSAILLRLSLLLQWWGHAEHLQSHDDCGRGHGWPRLWRRNISSSIEWCQACRTQGDQAEPRWVWEVSGTLVDFIAIDCASSPQGLKLRIDMCNGFSVILKELAAREVARLAQRQVDYSRCSTPHTAMLNSTHSYAPLHTQLYSTPHTAMLNSTHGCAPLHTAMLHETLHNLHFRKLYFS